MRKEKIFALTAVLLLVAATAMAAEGGEGAHHGGSWMNLLWRVINFAIFVGIIWKLAGKRMKEFFSGRRYQIETELKDLDERKAAAEKQLKEVEKNIANLQKEREQILAEFKGQGETLKASIIESANKTAEKIKAQAETTATQELRLAMDDIRKQMADMVVDAAEKMMAEKLSKEDHAQLIDKYLTKVVLN